MSLPERVAVVEHVAKDLERQFRDHKEESIRASAGFATKESVQTVHTRIDKEIEPAIANLSKQQSRLQFRNILHTAWLIVSLAAGLLLLYNHFVK